MSYFFEWFRAQKIKIILGLVVLIVLAILYYLFFPPVLWLTSGQSNVKLEINGESRGTLNKSKIMFLEPGTYTLRASKDGFLEYMNLIVIKKHQITKINIFLNEMYYVSGTPGNGSSIQASFLSYTADGAKAMLYSGQKFYTVPLGQKGYIAADYKAEEMTLNLGLAEGDKVMNVKYSPDKTRALLRILNGTEMKFKVANFNDQTVVENNSFYDADWLGNAAIIGLDKNNRKKIVQWNLAGENQEIATLTSSGSLISAGLDAKNASVITDTAVSIIDMATKTVKEVAIENEFIASSTAVASGQYVVTTTKKTYLTNSNGQKTEINIKPHFGAISLQTNADLIFVEFNTFSKNYDFKTYNLNSKKTRTLNTLSSDLGDPTDIIASKEYVNYIVNGSIMGFKIK